MSEKKLGIFSAEEINAINTNVELEKKVDVAAKKSNAAAAGLAGVCFAGGAATAAGGFAAAGV